MDSEGAVLPDSSGVSSFMVAADSPKHLSGLNKLFQDLDPVTKINFSLKLKKNKVDEDPNPHSASRCPPWFKLPKKNLDCI